MTHLEFNCSDEKAVALIRASRLYDEGVMPTEWISVDERLPEEREDVAILIRLDGCIYYRVGWWRGENVEWMQAGLGLIEGTVTHWMPLPEPPKEE